MRRWFLIGALLGLFSSRAIPASLQGYVRDAQGKALPGVTVDLEAEFDTGTRTVQSDQSGRYRLSSLRAGTYRVRAHSASSGEATLNAIRLSESELKLVNIVLKPALASVEFSDQPRYVVAGVAESTYVGGHGSEAGVRSAESLTRATASLKKNTSPESAIADAETEASLRAALDRDPNSAGLHHSMATAEERLGKPLDAVHEYQRAAELDASESNLFDWGTELLAHDAPPAAAEVFERGIRQFPHSTRMLLGSAVAFYLRGDYAQAARRFFTATDLNSSDPEPYLFLGEVQAPEIIEMADYRERVTRFVQLQPDNAQANYLYATMLWNRKTGPSDGQALARAQAALERAVHLDPALAPAYLQLGMLYAEKQDFSAAIEVYQKAITADPDLEQGHYRLAAAYRKLGDAQKAQHETEIFERLTRSSAQARELERSSMQRFVVKLKSPDSVH